MKYLIVSREYLSLHSLQWKAGDQVLRLSKRRRNENVSNFDICMRCLSDSVVKTTKNIAKKHRKGKVFSWIFAVILSVNSEFLYLFCYQTGNPFFAFTAPEGSLINQPFFTCGSPKFFPLLVSHRAISSDRSMQSQPVFTTCTHHWVFYLCEDRKD